MRCPGVWAFKVPAGRQPTLIINRLLLFILAFTGLPLFSHFQEVTVRKGDKIILQASTYGQSVGIALTLSLALVCLIALFRSLQARRGSLWQALRFGPGLFAFTALWHSWSTSSFSDGAARIEIKSGVGGPMAGTLFLTAALALILLDACLREYTDRDNDGHHRPVLTGIPS